MVCSEGNRVLSRQVNFSNIRNICCKMRRYILLMTVKKLITFLRCKFITFSTPNTNCHKTVSHVTTRPTHTLTFRSVHKLSYRHFNEDVRFVKYKKLTYPWTETLVFISNWIWKTSTAHSIQFENYSNCFLAYGRSIQNGINTTKRNKEDTQIQ
jgi:hypothetical protein